MEFGVPNLGQYFVRANGGTFLWVPTIEELKDEDGSRLAVLIEAPGPGFVTRERFSPFLGLLPAILSFLGIAESR